MFASGPSGANPVRPSPGSAAAAKARLSAGSILTMTKKVTQTFCRAQGTVHEGTGRGVGILPTAGRMHAAGVRLLHGPAARVSGRLGPRLRLDSQRRKAL